MDVFFAGNGNAEKLCSLKGIRKNCQSLKESALEVSDAFLCWGC